MRPDPFALPPEPRRPRSGDARWPGWARGLRRFVRTVASAWPAGSGGTGPDAVGTDALSTLPFEPAVWNAEAGDVEAPRGRRAGSMTWLGPGALARRRRARAIEAAQALAQARQRFIDALAPIDQARLPEALCIDRLRHEVVLATAWRELQALRPAVFDALACAGCEASARQRLAELDALFPEGIQPASRTRL